MSRTKRRAQFRESYEMLCEKYPLAFVRSESGKRTLPLKVGILQDILAENPQMHAGQLSIVVRRYCEKPRYLQAVIAGGFRVDLGGFPAGDVAPDQAEHARATLAAVSAERAERRKRERTHLKERKVAAQVTP